MSSTTKNFFNSLDQIDTFLSEFPKEFGYTFVDSKAFKFDEIMSGFLKLYPMSINFLADFKIKYMIEKSKHSGSMTFYNQNDDSSSLDDILYQAFYTLYHRVKDAKNELSSGKVTLDFVNVTESIVNLDFSENATEDATEDFEDVNEQSNVEDVEDVIQSDSEDVEESSDVEDVEESDLEISEDVKPSDITTMKISTIKNLYDPENDPEVEYSFWSECLKVEHSNKNRSTLINWIESIVESLSLLLFDGSDSSDQDNSGLSESFTKLVERLTSSDYVTIKEIKERLSNVENMNSDQLRFLYKLERENGNRKRVLAHLNDLINEIENPDTLPTDIGNTGLDQSVSTFVSPEPEEIEESSDVEDVEDVEENTLVSDMENQIQQLQAQLQKSNDMLRNVISKIEA